MACWSRSWFFCICVASVLPLCSHGEEEEAPKYLPGLLAEYCSGSTVRQKIDTELGFDWGDGAPDPRLEIGAFTARWSGFLFVQRDAEYLFSAFSNGSIKVWVGDELVLTGRSDTPAWQRSAPLELGYGYLPLRIEYGRPAGAGILKLYWESSQFEKEPIPPVSLVHLPAAVEETYSGAGAAVLRAHRCVACHQIPVDASPLPAPSLVRIKGTVHPEWLVNYLQNPAKGKAGVTMPDFGLGPEEAKAIAAYLWTRSESVKLPTVKPAAKDTGRQLVEQVGCLACHRIDGIGNATVFGGGDLSQIAAKRPAGHFALWLTKPEKLNAAHRMPVFDLSANEVADIAFYLTSLGKRGAEAGIDVGDPHTVAKGKELIEANRCHACHEISGFGDRKPEPLSWDVASLADGGCLQEPDASLRRPGFRFQMEERAASADYLGELPEKAVPLSTATKGSWLLEENNCLSCHSRDGAPGLRPVVATLGIRDAKKQAALVPPSLTAVGDKLNTEWLKEAVAGKAERLRPWLAPRMPRFRHSSAQREAIVRYFIGSDRIPDLQDREAAPAPESQQELLFAAQRLVGANGFGCMSCHTIGSYEPVGVELGARGSDLRFLEKRMRQPWFRRWTRNPARIVAGSEMPAINLASPGVLDGNIDRQLTAVWHGLNDENMVLPAADAVQSLVATATDPVVILRDVMEHAPDDQTTRPFAVSFDNGHHLLIDLDTLSIRKWWVGEFARQKTRGKTWYWEPAGLTLFDEKEGVPFVVLTRDGKELIPTSDVQSIGHLESFSSADDRASFRMKLKFPGPFEVKLTCSLRGVQEGIQLDLDLEGVPPGFTACFRERVASEVSEVRYGQVRLETPVGPARMRIVAAADGFTEKSEGAEHRDLSFRLHEKAGRWQGSLLLATAARPPKGVPLSSAYIPEKKVRKLPVVPGYEVLRLPLPDAPMPTGIAFATDGTMVLTDLKGGVYAATDANSDGLVDQYRLLSEHLAAPYGLLVQGTDVIVSHKHELLRLKDALAESAERTAEVLATGWGVTADYHDWAVGLVGTPEGAFYLSPSCQQDERPAAAAIGRGKVLKVEPDGTWSEYAAGIRFAMGIAKNEAGDLFTTDNQGVTNPFNELNHIREGHHYGFWSKLEPHPKDQVTTAAAIQIPHPWTRSVNGIAFVPSSDRFGPFADHLIGAEYTTRGLIRMSLQKIGATYQGCAYPFSHVTQEQMKRDETFLGPIAVAFGPDGALYVGSMIDSGWGGGNNRGAIERVKFSGELPFGIREVRAHPVGFDIDFTSVADPERARDVNQYTLSCYQRVPKGGYETPDQDRTAVTVERAEPGADGRSVRLFVHPMRPGFVYDIAIGDLHASGAKPFPPIAYYTLNQVPKE